MTWAELAGLGDDGGFLGVVLGVEYHCGHPGLDQFRVQLLGFGDIAGTHQHRLTGGVDLLDVLDDGLVLGRGGDVDAVGLVLADVGGVRRNRRHPELVELAQLFTGGKRGTGHAAHRGVPVDQRLHGDGVEHLTGFGGLDALLGLDRRLQAVGPAL